MSLAANIPEILKDNRLVPAHFDDAIAVFDGETEDTYSGGSVSLTTQRTNTINAINALIDTLKAAHPGETALLAELDQLKLDQASAVNTNVPASIDTNITISDVCEEAKTKLKTAIADYVATGDSLPYYGNQCGRCGGVGRYPADNDPGVTDTDDIECKSCGGLGRTRIVNQATAVTWPVTEPDYPTNP
jgi:hypothetical protein